MFLATVGWSHRAALRANFFRKGGDEDAQESEGGVNVAAPRPASPAVAAAVDGEAVLISAAAAATSSATSSSGAGEGVARRLASLRRRGESGGVFLSFFIFRPPSFLFCIPSRSCACCW